MKLSYRVSSQYAFTLIELLVVISIIGMLSSVVLVSLSGARDKGKLASVKTFVTNNYHKLGANAVLDVNFNEDSGVPIDSSGNYTSVSNITRVQDDPLGSGNSLRFGSPTFSPKSGNSINLSDQSGFTESIWYNFKGSTPSASINWISVATINNNEVSIDLFYSRSDGGIRCDLGSTYSGVLYPLNIFDTAWHNVVCTYDVSTNTTSLYVDGKLVTPPVTNDTSFVPSTLDGYIYIRTNSPALLDNVQIFSGSLLAYEVQRLYAYGLAKKVLTKNK